MEILQWEKKFFLLYFSFYFSFSPLCLRTGIWIIFDSSSTFWLLLFVFFSFFFFSIQTDGKRGLFLFLHCGHSKTRLGYEDGLLFVELKFCPPSYPSPFLWTTNSVILCILTFPTNSIGFTTYLDPHILVFFLQFICSPISFKFAQIHFLA